MRIHKAALLASVALLLAAGCDDDELEGTTPTSLLAGAWLASSIETADGDAVADGMSMVVTMNEAGSISFNITGDILGICDPGPDCNLTGTWTSTDTNLTIDDGTGSNTLTYSLAGGNMIWFGSVGGSEVVITFDRITAGV